MFNNNERKKFYDKEKKIYYDKDMKRNKILSEIITLLSTIIAVIAFLRSFLHAGTTIFISAIILILVLAYIGCKIDEMRGYE